MFLTFRRYLPAFSTVWTFSTTFFDYISRLLQTIIRSQPSVPAITLRDAWPLTTQQIYRYSSNFLDSVDEDAVRALGTQHHPQRLQCKIRDRQRGSFNACFFLEFSDGSARVVRLPLDPAVQDAWDKVRSEVYTMQFLRRHTNIPIPQVYTYGRSQLCRHTPEPQVFMIMEQVEGQQLTTETLSTSPESHRRRFLQQLVDVFVELRRLPFAQGGSLLPSNSEDLESPPDIIGAFSIRKNELQAVGYRVSRTIAANARDFLDKQLRILRCI